MKSWLRLVCCFLASPAAPRARLCGLGRAARGGLLLALSLAACQLSTDPPAARPALASRPASFAAAPAPAADSLASPDPRALTPVPTLPGIAPALGGAIGALHRALGPAAAGLRPAVLTQAAVGYLALREQGTARPGATLAVVDFGLPNTTPRLWVIDLKNQRVLHHSLVAHGRGSGGVRAGRFSSKIKSECSALGFYRTADTYAGKHGLSRRLHGLDAGQNSTALSRYVVLHGADYVSENYVAKYGHLGYSRGCPALPPAQYRAIIRALPAGSVLLLSGPGLASRWLNGAAAGRRFAARGWQ